MRGEAIRPHLKDMMMLSIIKTIMPKSIEQAINIIVNERSDWYSAIEEHMMSKLMKDNEKECE